MTFVFRSKGETLEALGPRVTCASVLPIRHFSVADWRHSAQAILDSLEGESWSGGPLIVRSSAVGEDDDTGSQAGRYRSCLGVAWEGLRDAVESVITSYGNSSKAGRVLVQPCLTEVCASGVVFTRDPSTGSPYLVVNGAEGADTTVVTGGKGAATWCHYHWRKGPSPIDERIKRLHALAEELVALCGRDALDLEFAFTRDGTLWLLQVRPLAMAVPPIDDNAHAAAVRGILAKVAQAMQPHPFLHGSRTVFGNMPDWNPAEIIGTRPSPLALSLYRNLVTDSIWAYQRHNYGYKNLRSHPLLVHFHGQPYIDVRVSFNSFIPCDIEDGLAEKLVDHYIERLLAKPALHDKVEFEIVFSAYTFDLPERLATLGDHGFSVSEREAVADSLRRLTNRIINRRTGLWQSDSAKLPVLDERRTKILGSSLPLTDKIYWLLEDCKRYGTLPFAGLARAGFVAVQMLRSLVATGVFSEEDRNAFMSSLTTIGSKLAGDFAALAPADFLDKYGHLRPGTYDIRSKRYDEAPELYGIATPGGAARAPQRPRFGLSLPQMRRIESLLAEHGLENDVVGLFDFLQAAIEGREMSKFIFTRSLSDALVLVGELGRRLGYSREDMAMVDIGVISELQVSSDDVPATIERSIQRGRERQVLARSIVLPSLIATPGDVWTFRMLEAEPNFITLGRVVAPVRPGNAAECLEGAIVCIPSADPGYDWVFGRGIAGLVTAFGGANSHMAIRAAELGLPAVIGAGEVNYRLWSAAKTLSIDCANRKVEIIE
ncbi:MAG: PEP/pyruvate-binding domain-containing protein [Bacteroidota bacterium]